MKLNLQLPTVPLFCLLMLASCAETTQQTPAEVPARISNYSALLDKAKAAVAAAGETKAEQNEVLTPETPFAPSPRHTKLGFAVYHPSLVKPFAGGIPAADEITGTIRLQAARNETASLLLAVHALKDIKKLAWEAPPLGKPLDRVKLEILPVLMSPLKRKGNRYDLVGLWVADGPAPVDIPNGRSRAWLLRVTVPKGAPPGTHVVPLQCSSEGLEARERVDLSLTIHPFTLVDPWERGYVFGAFCAGANFNVQQYRQMKAHGIEAIQWFWGHFGLDIRNEDGKLVVGFEDLDRSVGAFKEAGMRGPLVFSLGNDSSGHFDRAICRAFNLPLQPQVKRRNKVVKMATLDEPRTEELMIEALRQLLDHARENEWPEIVVLPYDEPTERLMDEHKRMVRIFRTHFPRVRLYGCSMNRMNWARQVADCDIIVCNGSFAGIRQLTRDKGLSTWFYGGSTSAQGFQAVRWRFGLQRFVHHPEGSWFWCYNYHTGDPWNEFDGPRGDSAWVICWPPTERGRASTNTIPFEGLREGVDDVRYAMTLEAMLERAEDPVAGEVRREYEAWRHEMTNAKPSDADVPSLRSKLTGWLTRLAAD